MPESRLALIMDEGLRLLAYARRDPERIVPQYPTWRLRDLVGHVASVHGRTLSVCQTLTQERVVAPTPASDRDVFDWYEATLADMVEALRAADPETPVWSVTAERTVGSWERRMLIETSVHRWDAQGAFESPDPLPADVAVAGLDEFALMWLPRLGALPALEVRASDLGRTWTFGQGDPVATVSASASELCLRLVARPGPHLPAAWEAAVDGLPTAAG